MEAVSGGGGGRRAAEPADAGQTPAAFLDSAISLRLGRGEVAGTLLQLGAACRRRLGRHPGEWSLPSVICTPFFFSCGKVDPL